MKNLQTHEKNFITKEVFKAMLSTNILEDVFVYLYRKGYGIKHIFNPKTMSYSTWLLYINNGNKTTVKLSDKRLDYEDLIEYNSEEFMDYYDEFITKTMNKKVSGKETYFCNIMNFIKFIYKNNINILDIKGIKLKKFIAEKIEFIEYHVNVA